MVDSVRTRLTLWYVSILALVLVVFSIGVYSLLSRALHARVDENLRSVIQITIKSLAHDAEEGQSSSKFYLDELLAESIRAGNILAARKQVTIEAGEFAESLFCGDEGLLRQMFLNLLDNAIKHTAAGGAVKVHFAKQQETYVIAISDTGGGIPAAAQAHIFKRFYRADKARSRPATYDGGAGLGLSIALWIAEVHQGSLKLQHSDAAGSRFKVILPVPANN